MRERKRERERETEGERKETKREVGRERPQLISIAIMTTTQNDTKGNVTTQTHQRNEVGAKKTALSDTLFKETTSPRSPQNRRFWMEIKAPSMDTRYTCMGRKDMHHAHAHTHTHTSTRAHTHARIPHATCTDIVVLLGVED